MPNITNIPSTQNVGDSLSTINTNFSELNDGIITNETAINANTQAIANLATAQGSFENTTTPVFAITTTEQTIPFTITQASSDTSIFQFGTNDIAFKKDAPFNFSTNMGFKHNTNVQRIITIRGRKVSDDTEVYSRTVTIQADNNDISNVTTSTLLTIGQGSFPSAPFDLYFTIQADGTGIELNDFSSILASGASYDINTGETVNFETLSANKTLVGGTDENIQFLNPGNNIVEVQLSGTNIGDKFFVSNNATISATGVLKITFQGSANTVTWLYSGNSATYYYNGTNWVVSSLNDGDAAGISRSVLLGPLARSSGNSSTAIGGSCSSSGVASIALGFGSNATEDRAISIGDTDATALYTLSAGYQSISQAEGAVTLGRSLRGSGIYSATFGYAYENNQDYSLSIGSGTSSSDTNPGGLIRLEADADQNNSKKSAIYLNTTTAPTNTTNRLYNEGGDLKWNGANLGHFKKTTSAMTSETLVVTDSDVTADSGIVWTASATPNGYIQVETSAGQVTFTSTVAETISFTYYIIK